MSKTTLEIMLERDVKWEPIERDGEYGGDLPIATHKGVLRILGQDMICYQLSDGRRIFASESIARFFGLEAADGQAE